MSGATSISVPGIASTAATRTPGRKAVSATNSVRRRHITGLEAIACRRMARLAVRARDLVGPLGASRSVYVFAVDDGAARLDDLPGARDPLNDAANRCLPALVNRHPPRIAINLDAAENGEAGCVA